MDTSKLEEKEIEIGNQFEKIQAEIRNIELQENALGQRKKEMNVELFRLQGEHRLIKDLLEPPAAEEEGFKEAVEADKV